MRAKFEPKVISNTIHTAAHMYKNVQNLPHWHIENELIYVYKGTAEIMVNNNFFELTENMGAFISGGEIHYIKSSEDSITGIIKTDAEQVQSISSMRHPLCPVLQNGLSVRCAIEEILAEAGINDSYSTTITDSIATKLTAEIFRTEETEAVNPSSKKVTDKYKELLEIISTDFADITFEKAAEYMNLNKSYFSRYFYRYSGMTFTKYINTLKVAAATEKIFEGKMSMTEISIACGFGTIRNFNRVFKEFTGYSPKKLPENYVFYNFKDNDKKDFDPTLNCTVVLI